MDTFTDNFSTGHFRPFPSGPPTLWASEIIKSVLLKLKKSLDDPKRVIRKEAALTWNVWSMVGQP